MRTYKKAYIILSFLIPITIYFSLFSIFGLITNKNFIYSDNLSQYLPTYKYLYNVLHGTATFPYTFSKGLGGTMFGALFYGLSSPFNILLYFFSDIELFMIISILFKIGLSGLTCFLLLNKKGFKHINCLIFSLTYSLSGYLCLYFIHIMWLDAVWLLPLLIIAIDKIISKDNDLMYIFILFISLLSNYYTGYMLTLFSVFYYIQQLYLKYDDKYFIKKNIKRILKFLLITFLVGCLVMFILIPVYYESLEFYRASSKWNFINLVFLDLFSGTYVGYENIYNTLNENAILIYCSTFSILLNVLYFLNKSISKKEKISTTILLLFMLLPVFIKPLDRLWHLFTNTSYFSYRYSFILILLIILNSIKTFELDSIYNKKIKFFLVFYLILSCSMIFTIKTNSAVYNLSLSNVFITLLFMIIGAILIYYKKNKLAYCLIVIELIFNLGITCFHLKKTQTYELKEKSVNILQKYNSSSYRIETTKNFTLNDGLYGNYNGVTTFLSSQNKRNILFGLCLKNTSFNNTYKYIHYNTFYDILVSLKYIIDKNINLNYKLLEEFEIDNIKYYLQENPYALNLGYTVSDKIKDFDIFNNKENSYFSDLFSSIDGEKNDYLIQLNLEKINSKAYIMKKNKRYSEIYLTTEFIPTNIDISKISQKDNRIIYFDQNNEDVKFEFQEDIQNLKAYTIDIEKIKNFVNNREQLILNENKGNFLSGTINVSKDSIMMLTMPYERGWAIYVDGIKVNYYELLDSFIGIDLTKGFHKIEMYYYIPGLELGIIISLSSLIIIMTYEIRKKDRLL